MKPNALCSHWTHTLTVEYWLSNSHPSETTGWRYYIFIFSPFNQLDKYWPTLALKCSNLHFGGYAVVIWQVGWPCKPEGERGSGRVGCVDHGWQYKGLLASTTATVAKTSLLKWIGVFFFFKLWHVYSSSLKMSNAGKFPWSWFLGDRTQV